MYRNFYQLIRFAVNYRRELRLMDHLREFERNQWLNTEELRQVSWQKLKQLLEHAYVNVPFYQQRFREVGLTPADIRTEADFLHLPLLTKEDINKHTDLLLARNYHKNQLKRDVTSGSTGVPLVLFRERDHDIVDVAAFIRYRHWFGCEPGDKIAWIWGRRGDISGLTLTQRLKRERWLDGYRPTPEKLQQYAEMLLKWKPAIIAGYGNVIYVFAEYLRSQQITGIQPKVIETTGMTIWPHEREIIAQVFQCPVSDRYGSHEAGAMIAGECSEHSKHIFNDFCYVEVLADEQPAKPGQMGEVIITPLYTFGMPLIRYRMADIAVLADKPCPCGRGLPVLDNLVGRTTSIFTLPSGKLLYGGIFRHIVLKDTLAIRQFRVHQSDKNQIEIFLQPGKEFDETIVSQVKQRCLAILEGEPVNLTITVTDDISTTAAGKFLVTTSDVPVSFN